MALPKQKFRELVFQILFSSHFLKDGEENDLGFYMQQLKTTRKNVEDAFLRVTKIVEQKPKLDEEISKLSTSYDVDRIQSVEMNVLRLCAYELLFEKETPYKIIISEGIRLAKKFSTKESLTFINAILDQLYKNNQDLAYTA